MHILPPLETVKDIAATQQYDVLPLSCEILSDFITPIEAMRILKNVSTHCYMLESAQADDRWGRYTFLGFDPKLEITCIDGKMKAGGLTVRKDDAPETVKNRLKVFHAETEPLKDFYKKLGNLKLVEGNQPIEHATRDILAALGE